MDCVVGKHSFQLDAAAFAERVAAHDDVLIDLGTGDGRFVRHLAAAEPRCLAIGVDLCREQMQRHSRAAPANALFVVANARALPAELTGVANRLTINFPWAELLQALAAGDRVLLSGLVKFIDPGREAEVLIRLNGAALTVADGSAVRQLTRSLMAAGFAWPAVRSLERAELRALPTNWAKRLAFGRDPHAWEVRTTYRPAPAAIAPAEPEFVSAAAAW